MLERLCFIFCLICHISIRLLCIPVLLERFKLFCSLTHCFVKCQIICHLQTNCHFWRSLSDKLFSTNHCGPWLLVKSLTTLITYAYIFTKNLLSFHAYFTSMCIWSCYRKTYKGWFSHLSKFSFVIKWVGQLFSLRKQRPKATKIFGMLHCLKDFCQIC